MRKTMKRKSGVKEASGQSPSKSIDAKKKELGDWRGRTLRRSRSSEAWRPVARA